MGWIILSGDFLRTCTCRCDGTVWSSVLLWISSVLVCLKSTMGQIQQWLKNGVSGAEKRYSPLVFSRCPIYPPTSYLTPPRQGFFLLTAYSAAQLQLHECQIRVSYIVLPRTPDMPFAYPHHSTVSIFIQCIKIYIYYCNTGNKIHCHRINVPCFNLASKQRTRVAVYITKIHLTYF